MRGRGGRCLPFLLKPRRRVSSAAVPDLALYDHDTVLKAISAADAVELVRDGFVRHATGEWVMPPKVYLDSPPHGDFRAMPARGAGLAILKWATSFPQNPARGLSVVNGVICVSDAGTGAMTALVHVEAVTALRTGAVAAVAAQELTGEADGRPSDESATLFDSTGLAIQDLAICRALIDGAASPTARVTL